MFVIHENRIYIITVDDLNSSSKYYLSFIFTKIVFFKNIFTLSIVLFVPKLNKTLVILCFFCLFLCLIVVIVCDVQRFFLVSSMLKW